ncbi:MAG: hypothetical protein ABEI74_02905 [Candidatus Pacearchaeota archaeon]
MGQFINWKKFPFHVVAFIITLLLVFFIAYTSGYVHEHSHINAAEKKDINLKYEGIDFTPNVSEILNWGHGASIPASEKDCKKFNSLSVEDKKDIAYAGIYGEGAFLIILFGTISVLMWRKGKRLRDKDQTLYDFALILWFAPLLILILSLTSNYFTSNPMADANIVYEGLRCSAY